MPDVNPNPFKSPDSVEKSVAGPSSPRRKKLFPPFSIRLIAAGFVLTAGIVRWFNITGDYAIVNILTFACGVFACQTLGIWFVFFSGYTRTIRFGTATAMIALLIIFASAFRVEEVSGEMVPKFRPRWTKRADETLRPAQPGEAEVRADLATVTSDDFPQFLGPERNGRVDHVKLAHEWPANPWQPIWKQPIGAGWSAFSAVNGFAVTMEQRGPEELVTCYEIATGKLIWSYATKVRHETIEGGPGPRSTPTIHAGRVYALGAVGELVCLEGTTGKLVWRTNLLERYKVPADYTKGGVRWGRANSPLVADDLVVVPAGGPVGGHLVSLAAFHRETGELVWEGGDQQVSYSSPIEATIAGVRQIVCVHEKSVAGHDIKSGKVLWSFEWLGDSTANANVSQPVPVGDDQLFLSKGYGQGAALLHLSANPEGQISATSRWDNQSLLKTKFTNVVLYQGHLYGLSDGIMECVNVDTGKRVWKKGRYYQGQILGVGDVILVQEEFGDVAMIAATPAGYTELGRFKALEGKTWNNLCLYGKRLLVRNAEEAACYELP